MASTNRFASRLSIASRAAHLAAGAALVACSLSMIGCSSKAGDAVAVAQVAVRANPELELVATDDRQAVLTVRVRRTGRILTVRADDVVAGSAFRDLDTTAARPDPPPAAATPPAPAAPAGPARQAERPAADAPVAVVQSTGEGKKRQAAAPVKSNDTRSAPAETSSAPASTGSSSRAVPRTAEQPAETPKASDLSASAQTPPARRVSPSPQSPRSSAGDGASIDDASLQRRTNPVQCRGAETVRLDGVLLQTDRVAIEAMGKCGVHITNSHVIGRVAVQALGEATVTIENSIIEGRIQATQTSTISARSSTIQGRVMKLQGGTVRDLGQNVWR
jgi:hypothetical protein